MCLFKSDKYYGAYSTFEGSPASQGLLQFDLWNCSQDTNRYNWEELKKNIMKYKKKTIKNDNNKQEKIIPLVTVEDCMGAFKNRFLL